jgi:hypothetical protein
MEKTPSKLPLIVAIAGLAVTFVLIVGMILFFDIYFARQYAEATRAQSFVETKGEIEEVIKTRSEDSEPTDVFEIKFNYTVDRQLFRQSSQDNAEFLDRYPEDWTPKKMAKGDGVAVFYDPADPSKATLSKSLSFGTWILASILGVFNLIVLYGSYRIFRFGRKVFLGWSMTAKE